MGNPIASHRLGDARQYARLNRDIQPPPDQYLENIEPGDLVMLLDESPDSTAPLWAEIEEVLGPGWYLGRTELGRGVEFSSRHIADLESGPRASMGAWYDTFRPTPPKTKAAPTGVFRHFAPGGGGAAAAPKTPPPPPRGSIFDVFKRGAPGSFFRWFRGKPQVETEPIPRSERRQPPSFLRLPGSKPEVQDIIAENVQEPIQRPAGPLVVSEPQATLQPMADVPQGIPDDIFSVLAPPSELPPVPTEPTKPQAVIIAPEVHLPTQIDAFSILEPEKKSYGPPGGAIPQSRFEMFIPEPISPFDILVEPDAPAKGIVVRENRDVGTSSVFDILEPERSIQTYQAPASESKKANPEAFETMYKEFSESREPEAPKAKKKPTQKKGSAWRMPTREEWVKLFKEKFDLPGLWKYITKDREDEQFLQAQLDEMDTAEAPVLPIETWGDGDWDEIFGFFGIPNSAWVPYLDKIKKEEDEGYDGSEGWEEFREGFLYPLSESISDAFESVKPRTLPGRIVLDDDPQTGLYGLLYYESLPEEQMAKRRKEVNAAREKFFKEQQEKEKFRKAQIKKIWGKMPSAEDIVPWIEERYDLERMFKDIKKEKKTKAWKEEAGYGEASMVLDVVADIGPKRSKDYDYDVASYFGIPPDVVTLYQDSDSEQELWSEVFWPFFDRISEAFSMLLPYAELEGTIVVDEDPDDQLAVQYREP